MAGKKKPKIKDNPWHDRFRPHFHVQTVETVREALYKFKGNYSAVARYHGVVPSAVTEFIKDHPELEHDAAQARRKVIDHVEYNLFEEAESGERWAMEKVLDCLARDRGYGRQVAVTGPIQPDGSAGPVQIQIVMPDNFRERSRPAVAEQVQQIAIAESEEGDNSATVPFPQTESA